MGKEYITKINPTKPLEKFSLQGKNSVEKTLDKELLNENYKTDTRDNFIEKAKKCPYCSADPKKLKSIEGYDEHHIRKTTGEYTNHKLVVLWCTNCNGVVFVKANTKKIIKS